jgi:cystathionine beta-lyase/cystathionine gamma-synthase
LPARRARAWPHGSGVVRFAIGLASAADLQADLASALETL